MYSCDVFRVLINSPVWWLNLNMYSKPVLSTSWNTIHEWLIFVFLQMNSLGDWSFVDIRLARPIIIVCTHFIKSTNGWFFVVVEFFFLLVVVECFANLSGKLVFCWQLLAGLRLLFSLFTWSISRHRVLFSVLLGVLTVHLPTSRHPVLSSVLLAVLAVHLVSKSLPGVVLFPVRSSRCSLVNKSSPGVVLCPVHCSCCLPGQ